VAVTFIGEAIGDMDCDPPLIDYPVSVPAGTQVGDLLVFFNRRFKRVDATASDPGSGPVVGGWGAIWDGSYSAINFAQGSDNGARIRRILSFRFNFPGHAPVWRGTRSAVKSSGDSVATFAAISTPGVELRVQFWYAFDDSITTQGGTVTGPDADFGPDTHSCVFNPLGTPSPASQSEATSYVIGDGAPELVGTSTAPLTFTAVTEARFGLVQVAEPARAGWGIRIAAP
jgi:hypothetical protein